MARAAGVATPRAVARAGRRLAVETLFEADFGQRTPAAVLARRVEAAPVAPEEEAFARRIVDDVVRDRDRIDSRIEAAAPAYPVVQLGRIDRALLRSALGEMLHSATPTRVVIAEWVALARVYSGEPARRLVNGVLGRIARENGVDRTDGRRDGGPAAPSGVEQWREQGGRDDVRATQEDRRGAAGRRRRAGHA
jgi:N utilization substance protein B